MNGDETDVDCGGNCVVEGKQYCATGKNCCFNSDCGPTRDCVGVSPDWCKDCEESMAHRKLNPEIYNSTSPQGVPSDQCILQLVHACDTDKLSKEACDEAFDTQDPTKVFEEARAMCRACSRGTPVVILQRTFLD